MLKILTCKHLFNVNETEFWYFEKKKAEPKYIIRISTVKIRILNISLSAQLIFSLQIWTCFLPKHTTTIFNCQYPNCFISNTQPFPLINIKTHDELVLFLRHSSVWRQNIFGCIVVCTSSYH